MNISIGDISSIEPNRDSPGPHGLTRSLKIQKTIPLRK